MDDELTKPQIRVIIEDFADDIKRQRQRGAKPSKEVVHFRNWASRNKEQPVWEVPTEFLRFRKENGRIKSDILSYERNRGPLSERSDESQEIIRKFLKEKDPVSNKDLVNSIRHTGQRNAAIITADGFLINGNRRKMALEELWEDTKDKKFRWMKVVILPGKENDSEGAPPTLKEIEEIENRYQLQSSGKSEYYNFDKALSMRDKDRLGMTLIEQLRDDPNYARLSDQALKQEVRRKETEFIKPLECIDNYLEQLGRSGLYDSISTGISDRDGRWQAFVDYSKHVRKKLDDEHQRMKLGIDEFETGDVEEIAFKIIRKREFPGLKAHMIMRDLPKWLVNNQAKKELFKLRDINFELPKEDCFNEDGLEYDERKRDQIWSTKHATSLIKHVKDAQRIVAHEKERETPLTLLEAALSKLEHENMDPEAVNYHDFPKAMELARDVRNAAKSLEADFYRLKKEQKNKLKDKFG